MWLKKYVFNFMAQSPHRYQFLKKVVLKLSHLVNHHLVGAQYSAQALGLSTAKSENQVQEADTEPGGFHL